MTARRSDYTAADVQAWADAVAWLRQGERMAREQISKAKEEERLYLLAVERLRPYMPTKEGEDAGIVGASSAKARESGI